MQLGRSCHDERTLVGIHVHSDSISAVVARLYIQLVHAQYNKCVELGPILYGKLHHPVYSMRTWVYFGRTTSRGTVLYKRV